MCAVIGARKAIYANAEGLGPGAFSEPDGGKGQSFTDLDRWALSRLQGTTAAVRERMDEFDCTTAGRSIAELDRGQPGVRTSRAW